MAAHRRLTSFLFCPAARGPPQASSSSSANTDSAAIAAPYRHLAPTGRPQSRDTTQLLPIGCSTSPRLIAGILFAGSALSSGAAANKEEASWGSRIGGAALRGGLPQGGGRCYAARGTGRVMRCNFLSWSVSVAAFINTASCGVLGLPGCGRTSCRESLRNRKEIWNKTVRSFVAPQSRPCCYKRVYRCAVYLKGG